MTHDGQFLDAVAQAMPADGEAWEFETLADGGALVARLNGDESTVAVLVDVQSLDSSVTADDVARVAELGARIGAATISGSPAVFVCTRRTPADDAVWASYRHDVRILSVCTTGDGSWGYERAVVSHQEFTQPPAAPTLSEPQWRAIHAGSDRAVFHDTTQHEIASFAGLCATLVWREANNGSWGSCRFDLPAGTVMVVPDQPPLPVAAVTLQFHKEIRPLRATGEAPAFAELVSQWVWGW